MTKITESAGGVVLNSEGLVVMVSQKGLGWSLPKGRLDPGEDSLTAAKREIWEESGIKNLTLIKKLGTYERYLIAKDSCNGDEDKSELKIITLYLFTTDQIELCPQDADNPEACWVAKEEVVKMFFHKKDKEFFESIMKELL